MGGHAQRSLDAVFSPTLGCRAIPTASHVGVRGWISTTSVEPSAEKERTATIQPGPTNRNEKRLRPIAPPGIRRGDLPRSQPTARKRSSAVPQMEPEGPVGQPRRVGSFIPAVGSSGRVAGAPRFKISCGVSHRQRYHKPRESGTEIKSAAIHQQRPPRRWPGRRRAGLIAGPRPRRAML